MEAMKILSTTVLAGAGLLYGLMAVVIVYHDVPIDLQAFIVACVACVAAAGAAVGWPIGFAASLIQKKCRAVNNRAAQGLDSTY